MFSEIWKRSADAGTEIEDARGGRIALANEAGEIDDFILGEIFRLFARDRDVRLMLSIIVVSHRIDSATALVAVVWRAVRHFALAAWSGSSVVVNSADATTPYTIDSGRRLASLYRLPTYSPMTSIEQIARW